MACQLNTDYKLDVDLGRRREVAELDESDKEDSEFDKNRIWS